MPTQHELITAVRAASGDTPYALKETPKGFDLTIDVADARWLGLLRAHGLKKVFTHQVSVDEAKQQISITDVANTLSWGAGGSTPRLSVEKSVARGRIYEKSVRKEYGVDLDTGHIGKVVDYTFDASQGRDIVRAVAEGQGWSEKMGREQRGGLIVGIAALVLTVAVFAVVGIQALLR